MSFIGSAANWEVSGAAASIVLWFISKEGSICDDKRAIRGIS